MTWCVPWLSIVLLSCSAAAVEAGDQSSGTARPRNPAMEKILAERRGETPEVRALVAGRDPNARDKARGRTALMWAIAFNDRDAFERFLGADAEVNAVDDEGSTALLQAAESAMKFDTAWMVEALIAKGAQVGAGPGAAGMTPLMHAANANAPAVARAVLAKLDAASIDASNNDGMTALIVAAAVGAHDVARQLLEKGARIDLYDLEGKTPLMHAAGHRFPGSVATVKLLLEMGADPAAKDRDGRTALSEAKQYGSPEIVALLQKAGAQ